MLSCDIARVLSLLYNRYDGVNHRSDVCVRFKVNNEIAWLIFSSHRTRVNPLLLGLSFWNQSSKAIRLSSKSIPASFIINLGTSARPRKLKYHSEYFGIFSFSSDNVNESENRLYQSKN